MAKRKSTTPAKSHSASSTNRKPVAPSDARSTAAARKTSATTQPTISNEAIGHVAGEVWSLLAKEGGQPLADIKKSIVAPTELVSAAIGWLAREDKLDFSKAGRSIKVALR